MAAGTLPKPGSKFGPCEIRGAGTWNPDGTVSPPDACTHADCVQTRRDAACVCRFCKQRIGYDVRHYIDPDDKATPVPSRALVHAACLEDSIDAARAARVSP